MLVSIPALLVLIVLPRMSVKRRKKKTGVARERTQKALLHLPSFFCFVFNIRAGSMHQLRPPFSRSYPVFLFFLVSRRLGAMRSLVSLGIRPVDDKEIKKEESGSCVYLSLSLCDL